jgi:Tol biopolymer transport system component
MARPFDPVKRNLTGDAVSVAEGVQTDPLFSNGVFSVSQNSMLLYQAGRGPSAHSVVIVDRTGKPLRRLEEAPPGTSPRFSPDAKNVAYDLVLPSGGGRIELWMADIISGGRSRLTSDPLSLVSHSVVWSPNGTHLAYSCAKSSSPSICIRAIGQIAQEEERWEAKDNAFVRATNWTPMVSR